MRGLENSLHTPGHIIKLHHRGAQQSVKYPRPQRLDCIQFREGGGQYAIILEQIKGQELMLYESFSSSSLRELQHTAVIDKDGSIAQVDRY